MLRQARRLSPESALSRPTGLGVVLRLALILAFLLGPAPLLSTTIRVPADFPTIHSAVQAARDGDAVVVGDGLYLEDNIVIDKDIAVKAEHAFGAIICGVQQQLRAVFIVRAAVRIEGFVIKNAGVGIIQRDSPDVEWTGRDLAFLNIQNVAVDINDAEKNVGRARVSNVIVDRSSRAFGTNDANGIHVENAVVVRCGTVFAGGNHLSFSADRTVVMNCERVAESAVTFFPHEGTHRIALGRDVLVLDPQALSRLDAGNVEDVLFRYFSRGSVSSPGPGSRLFLTWFAFLQLGDVSMEARDYGRAREAYARAARAAQSLNLEFMPRACLGIARAAELAGDNAGAIEYYRKAVVAVEDLKARLPLRIFREGFFLDKLEIYDRALSLLFRLHSSDTGETYSLMALRLIERARGGGFLEILWRLRAAIKSGLAPDDRSREQETFRRINDVQARLEDPSLAPAEIEALSARLEEAETDLNALLSDVLGRALRGAHPESPVGPRAVRDIAAGDIAPDTALVVYAAGPRDTYALLVTARGIRFASIGETRDVRVFVENYLAFLQDRPEDPFRGSVGGRRLYDLLLGPLLDLADKTIKKLVFIPDDVLWYLPFEALIGDADGKFLIEDFEVAYSPSISYLLNLKNQPRLGALPMDLLAVANEEGRSLPELVRNTTFRLPPLRFAAMEVLNISRLFPSRRRTVLIDDQVSEDSFKRLRLADFRIIHLATHGFLDDERWWRSALLLRPAPGVLDDGLLQALELLDLTFQAELVVLSGCRTARGKLFRGEGVMGLSGAFMAAGAKSVLSSLWPINDRSTARLMESFYRYLAEGRTKAEALRLGKLKMLGSSYGHPYHWAAFVLSGDFDRPVAVKGRLKEPAPGR